MGKWSFKGLLKRKDKGDGLVSLEIGPSGIALAKIKKTDGAIPHLSICEYFDEANFLKQKSILHGAIEKYGLKGHSCNLVLHPSDYQLLLVEAPDVPAEELKQAMKWRIKDLVTEPLEDLIVDVFPLPSDAFRGRTSMTYVVSTSKKVIQQHVKSIEACGLELKSIDISELCLRNITALLLDQPKDSVGLLMLDQGGGLINLTEGNSLYLSRKIEMDVNEISGSGQGMEQRVESLALEVQRSLDYYESQLGKGVISRLLVAPMSVNVAGAFESLNNILNVKIDHINLSSHVEMGNVSEITQSKCFAAIGAALRREAA